MTELREHPIYKDSIQDWNDYRVLYEGKHNELIDIRYLWLHEIESTRDSYTQDNDKRKIMSMGAKLRRIREQRSRYVNYMKAIYKRYIGILFKQDAAFNDLEPLEDELQDCDGHGTRFLDFMANAYLERFLYARAYILINSFDTGAESMEDEQELGQRPYLELLNTLNVKDWQSMARQDRGQFEFIRHESRELEKRDSFEDKPKFIDKSDIYWLDNADSENPVYKITTFQRDDDNRDWEQVNEVTVQNGTEAFNYVPVCAWVAKESFAENLKDPILENFNIRSYANNVLGYHGHTKIVITGTGDNDSVQLSEAATLLIEAEGSVTQLTPDSHDFLRHMLAQSEVNIFKAGFFMSRFMPSDSRVSSSVESLQEQKEEFLSVIKAEINSLNDYMNKVIKSMADFKGLNDFEGKIEISDDVTLQDVNELLLIINSFREEIKSNDSWSKSVNKKAVSLMSLAEEEDIVKSIEEGQNTNNNPVIQNINSIVDGIRTEDTEA